MPTASPKPCCQCGALVRDGTTRCDKHKVRANTFADSRRGSRHQRGYGTAWDKQREDVKRRAAGLCEPCLAVGYVHVGHACDHRISKAEWQRLHGSLDGVDDRSNLQWINRDCHAAKTVIDRMRAAGDDVAPWAPAPRVGQQARHGAASGLGAPLQAAASVDQQAAGGGEKSAVASARTDLFGEFSCAGNVGGGGTPDLSGGVS